MLHWGGKEGLIWEGGLSVHSADAILECFFLRSECTNTCLGKDARADVLVKTARVDNWPGRQLPSQERCPGGHLQRWPIAIFRVIFVLVLTKGLGAADK